MLPAGKQISYFIEVSCSGAEGVQLEASPTRQQFARRSLCLSRAYAFSKRERQDLQSCLGMTTVVAQTSSDGRKPSTAEQAHSSITQSGHDFGSIVDMNGTSIFSQ